MRLARERDVAITRIGAARLDGYTDGSLAGYKRGWGEAYTAAMKAERRGHDPIAAIVRVGKLNAPALLARDTGEVLQ